MSPDTAAALGETPPTCPLCAQPVVIPHDTAAACIRDLVRRIAEARTVDELREAELRETRAALETLVESHRMLRERLRAAEDAMAAAKRALVEGVR